ncbi:hypothetical protein ACFSL6_10415 [Paenibacillus thailandensis]|uniref:Uncharacterized protein n=1 Tax=Paenibacillus thailandensis TaxID=393250 RepID=A0ABW5R5A3_9BACL
MGCWDDFFLFTNYYGNISTALNIIFNIVGWIALIIGVIGMMIETSRVLKNEAFSYWGVSLAFIIPLVLLHFYQINFINNLIVINIIKSLNVILFLIGSGIFLYGISFFFKNSTDPENEPKKKSQSKKGKIETVVTISIALISIVTAIIQLTTELIKIG